MKFASFAKDGQSGLAIETADGFRGLLADAPGFPGDLLSLIRAGGAALTDAGECLAKGEIVDVDAVTLLPPVSAPEKIVCVGLNYRDHSAESGFAQPEFPTLFGRFNSSLIGHGAPILRPEVSEQLD